MPEKERPQKNTRADAQKKARRSAPDLETQAHQPLAQPGAQPALDGAGPLSPAGVLRLQREIGNRRTGAVVEGLAQRAALSDVPAGQRRALQIRVQRPELPAARVTEYFTQLSSGGYSTTMNMPGDPAVELGAGVPAGLTTPLTTVAAHYNRITVEQSGQTAPMLGPNTALTVQMNLSAHGGAAGLYRFTWYNVPASGGGGRLLVESLSPPPVQQQAAYAAAQGQAPGTITAGGHSFELTGGASSWTAQRVASVQGAISLLPPAALAQAAGLRISVLSGGLGTGVGSQEEGGHYDPETDTVSLYRGIWGQPQGPGQAAAPSATNPVQVIAHEIAHAIDRRPLRRAEQAFEASGQSQADITALLGARSPSGGRFTITGGAYGFSDVLTTTQGNAFRQAYIQDGASVSGGRIQHAVTMYGAGEWQELYAEAFSLYITDPTTLEQARPHVYRHFAGQFPRQPAAAPNRGRRK